MGLLAALIWKRKTLLSAAYSQFVVKRGPEEISLIKREQNLSECLIAKCRCTTPREFHQAEDLQSAQDQLSVLAFLSLEIEILSMILTICYRSENYDTISFNDLLQLTIAKVSDLNEVIVEMR